MNRYFVSIYTDGPATRWNVIDRKTQEWVRRFPTKEAAEAHIANLEGKIRLGRCQRLGHCGYVDCICDAEPEHRNEERQNPI